MKKAFIFGLTAVGLLGFGTTTVHAQSIYSAGNPFWRHSHWVTITKSVNVYKVRNVIPRYKSYAVASYTLKRGAHYKLDHWGIDYSWVLQSGKFNSGSKYTYPVIGVRGHNWFIFGKKTLDPHKINKQSDEDGEDVYLSTTSKTSVYTAPYSKKSFSVKAGTTLSVLGYATTNNKVKWCRIQTSNKKSGWVKQRGLIEKEMPNHLSAILNSNNTEISGNTAPYAYVSIPETFIPYVQADASGNYKMPLIESGGYYNTDGTLHVISYLWGHKDAYSTIEFVGRDYTEPKNVSTNFPSKY